MASTNKSRRCMICNVHMDPRAVKFYIPNWKGSQGSLNPLSMNLFWAWVKSSRNPDLLKLTAQQIRARHPVVCRRHFSSKDFVSLDKLKFGAVPTLNLPSSTVEVAAVIDYSETANSSRHTLTLELPNGASLSPVEIVEDPCPGVKEHVATLVIPGDKNQPVTVPETEEPAWEPRPGTDVPLTLLNPVKRTYSKRAAPKRRCEETDLGPDKRNDCALTRTAPPSKTYGKLKLHVPFLEDRQSSNGEVKEEITNEDVRKNDEGNAPPSSDTNQAVKRALPSPDQAVKRASPISDTTQAVKRASPSSDTTQAVKRALPSSDTNQAVKRAPPSSGPTQAVRSPPRPSLGGLEQEETVADATDGGDGEEVSTLTSSMCCRVCLRVLQDDRRVLLFEVEGEEVGGYPAKLRSMLELLMPEINFQIYPDPVICHNCLRWLENSVRFKKLLMKTESTLKHLHPKSPEIPKVPEKASEDTSSVNAVKQIIWELKRTKDIFDPVFDRYFAAVSPATTSVFLQRTCDRLYRVKPGDKGDGPYLCEFCGVVFAKKSHHQEQKHNLKGGLLHKSFMCDVCGLIYKGLTSFTQHRTKHRAGFKCGQCNKKLSSQKYLHRHVSKMHRKPPDKHQCDVCGKFYTLKANLRKHRLKHSQRGPLKCSICEQRFWTRRDLTKHSFKHTNIFYRCSVCNAKIKRFSSLKLHMLIVHENQGKFKCNICNKSYWKKCTIVEHNIKVHGGNPPPQPKRTTVEGEEPPV